MNKGLITIMVRCVDCFVVIGHRRATSGSTEYTGLCWECGLAREEAGKEANAMTVVCSWCGKFIKHIDGENPAIISHGICDGCAKKLKEGYFEENPRRLLEQGHDLDG